MCSEFEKTLIVAIKERGTAEIIISSVIKIINSIINCILFFVTKWSS